MQLRDVEKLLDRLADSVKAMIGREVGKAAEALEAFSKRLMVVENGMLLLQQSQREPKDGQDGKSVSLEDVRPLLSELVARAFEEMPKPRDGRDGKNGADADGDVLLSAALAVLRPEITAIIQAIPKPKDGESPSLEALDRLIADRVSVAIAKIPAPQHGRDGRNGEHGRDAADIDILNAVSPGRAYPRGTFASHAGGLLRAARDTDPGADDLDKAGWRVVVDGVAAVVITQKSERTFAIACQLTSGKTAVSEFTVPSLIDRGVYRAGKTYEAGDGVTWDGSFWIAQRTTSAKPETEDWRMAVKKGRDGKDAKGAANDAPREVVRLR